MSTRWEPNGRQMGPIWEPSVPNGSHMEAMWAIWEADGAMWKLYVPCGAHMGDMCAIWEPSVHHMGAVRAAWEPYAPYGRCRRHMGAAACTEWGPYGPSELHHLLVAPGGSNVPAAGPLVKSEARPSMWQMELHDLLCQIASPQACWSPYPTMSCSPGQLDPT
jgi:hypothetical protein